jgi:phosphate transport system permease protein
MTTVNVPSRPQKPGGPRAKHTAWRLTDRIGLGIAWALGLLFCALAAGIVLYVLVQGIRYVTVHELFTSPKAGYNQSQTGGFLDPIEGTFTCSVIAMVIALPIGVAVAVWLSEFGRPPLLARLCEMTIEMLAGTPDIVLALFGLIIFETDFMSIFSQKTGQVVLGRSYFAAGTMLSLIALPQVVTNVREGLQAIPSHVREASYAVGKSKTATIRRVLIPAARPNILTGSMIGLGRVIGDTSIILLLAGGTLNNQPAGGFLGFLRGQGTSLTSYIYNNAPTGEYNQPTKADAAAFVLLAFVLVLNLFVEFSGKRAKELRWS